MASSRQSGKTASPRTFLGVWLFSNDKASLTGGESKLSEERVGALGELTGEWDDGDEVGLAQNNAGCGEGTGREPGAGE